MSERPSVIIEDDIYDPMVGWRERQSERNTVSELSESVQDDPTPQDASQESESQEVSSPTQEDSAQNDSQGSGGVEVIGNEALCTCTGATSPGTAVALKVVSQQRVLCNGGSLLVATDRDNTIASLNFGTCKLINNASCVAAITWQNPYTDVNILGSLKILTMESKGICKAATIQFETSGQSRSVSTSDITGVQAEAAQANNPLISAEGIRLENSTMETVNAQAEEAIRKEMEEPQIAEHKEGNGQNVRVTGITPVTFRVAKQRGAVKQPLRTLCSFRAASGGTLTWKVRNDNMSVIKESIGAGEITLQFPKKGRYVIEAYRESSYVKDNTQTSDIERNPNNYKNALIVDVTDNEIKLKTQKNKYPINIPVEITAEKLFDLPIDIRNLNYQVLETGVAVGSSVAEITPTSTGANVVFKKGGTYVVHAVAANNIKITPTDGIELEKLKVTSVTANSEQKYKARLKENLEFEAKLNYTDANAQSVKWRVDFSRTETGSKVQKYPAPNTHVSVKPSMSLFSEPGFYHIYAYINDKSESVKAVVELVKPVFVVVSWKDINGNRVLEIGKREIIYANIDFEGVAGLEIQYQLCLLSTHEVLENHIIKMRGTRFVCPVSLSDNICRRLSNGSKFYWKVSCKDTSITLENKTKAPKEFPLTYTTKESITGFAFYKDKNCRESLSIATYGSTVYVRVLTRNLTGKSLDVSIFRKTPGWFYGTNEIELHTSESQVNDEGFAIFKIVISNDWKNKGNDSYAITVTEQGDRFFKEEGVSNWQKNDTAKEKFVIGKNLLFMRFVDEPTPAEGGKVLTMVNQTNPSKNVKQGKCSRCEADITTDEIKKLCVDSTGKSMITDDGQLQEAVDFFNENKEFFDLTTCTRKVHFLSQIAEETHFSKLIESSFDYSKSALKNTFSAFRTDAGKRKADLWGRDSAQGSPSVTTENQIRIANWAYARPGNDRGNIAVVDADLADASKDGYRYRGRGYIQITGRSIYKDVSDCYNKWLAIPKKKTSVDWLANEDELLRGKHAMAASMTYWRYSNLISRSDMGTGENALKVVTKKINGGLTNLDERRRLLQKAIEVLACKDCVDHKRRNANEGTVIIVSGTATEKILGFAAYPVSVYRGMTLETYKDLKSKNQLPEPDYKTRLSRDAFQKKSTDGKRIFKRTEKRYGYAGECPPGEYYLNNKEEAAGRNFMMYLSDSPTGSIIKGRDGNRDGIAFHQYTGDWSIGCLTTLTSGKSTELINELKDAIPDLFIHDQMANANITIARRYIRVILEEREVEEEKWEKAENGIKRWRGTITK